MKRITIALFVAACAIPFMMIPDESDAADAATTFQVCAGCHGAKGEGNPELKTPAIGGQESWYLTRQLKNFKSGVRGADAAKDPQGNQMAQIAKTLDDATVATIAAYVATLPKAPSTNTLGGNAANGAKHFVVCAACHGEGGKGKQDTGAPALLFQQDWYVVKQIGNFKSGVRGTHAQDTFGVQMKAVADTLDATAMKDVAAYITTLPR